MPNKSEAYHYEPTGELRLDDNSQVWPGWTAGNEAHHFIPFAFALVRAMNLCHRV
jgi:hypothetical protein